MSMADPAFTELVQRIRKHFFTPGHAGLDDRWRRASPCAISRFFERPVAFRPAVPLRRGRRSTRRRRLFVRVEIEVEGRGRAVGASAELMVPKWFDKRPHLSPEQTVDELRRSLAIARELYLARSGFRHRVRPACRAASARRSRPARKRTFRRSRRLMARRKSTRRSSTRCCAPPAPISSTAWPAISPASMRGCRPISTDDDIARFLPARKPLPRVAIRHTVGLDDTVEGEGGVADATRKRRRALFQAQARRRSRRPMRRGWPRIGKRARDAAGYDYSVTLDANEQYADLAALDALVDRLDHDAALAADRAAAALYRAAAAARHHRGSRRSARSPRATSSSTRPTIPTTHSRRRARSAIAASRRSPARVSTSR